MCVASGTLPIPEQWWFAVQVAVCGVEGFARTQCQVSCASVQLMMETKECRF